VTNNKVPIDEHILKLLVSDSTDLMISLDAWAGDHPNFLDCDCALCDAYTKAVAIHTFLMLAVRDVQDMRREKGIVT